MVVLMNDHACREAIKELVCLVRDDALPVRARDCMLASWLVALPKADSGCRPIAGGTVVTKLAVCCSMITCDKAIMETFAEHGLQALATPTAASPPAASRSLSSKRTQSTSCSSWTSNTHYRILPVQNSSNGSFSAPR